MQLAMMDGVMRNLGVGSWMQRWGRIAPDRTAVISGGRSWTYGEVDSRVRRLAQGLRSLGLEKGDRVGWLGQNHPAFLEAPFAAGSLGVVLVPVNHRLEEAAILRVLEDSEITALVAEQSMARVPVPATLRSLLFVRKHEDAASEVDAMGVDYEALVERSPNDPIDEPADLDDLCMLPYTSGTTGRSKGVMLTHGNVAWNVVNWSAPPSGPTADLSSIRFIMTGGVPVPERLIRAYLDRGVTLLQGYGLSEAAPLALMLDPASALRKVGSAGKPPLLVDIRIVHPDLYDVGAGETGELLVRGPNVMAGYWKLPEATSKAIDDDGWLRTGDAARMDDEGYVWIVDRVQDGYVSRGQIVYPGNVERVLMAHPAVIEAGVVGLPEERGSEVGSVGVAFVVIFPDRAAAEEDLLAHCRGNLAEHEVPASVTVVDRLPRNSVGKLLRSELRSRAETAAPKA